MEGVKGMVVEELGPLSRLYPITSTWTDDWACLKPFGHARTAALAVEKVVAVSRSTSSKSFMFVCYYLPIIIDILKFTWYRGIDAMTCLLRLWTRPRS